MSKHLLRRRILIQLIAAIVLTCAAAIAFSVWALADGLLIKDAFATPTLGSGKTAAVYFNILNGSEIPDKLTAISTDVASRAEIHQSKNENGIASMEKLRCVEIPAHHKVVLGQGGLHVMLVGVKRPLKVGDVITVSLTFENAGDLAAKVPVRAPIAQADAPAEMQGANGETMDMSMAAAGLGSGACD